MTGLLRKATLLTACGVLLAAAALADVPSPGNCTVPACVSLVGSSAGVPDSTLGKFCVVVRDLANNPINGSSVVVDFSNDADARICSDQLNVNYLINCAAATVRAFTDVTGTVCFTILGESTGAGNGVVTTAAGRIFADGVLIDSPGVNTFDLDGLGGVGAGDLSVWLSDFGSNPALRRSDFDCSGGVGAGDLSLWLAAFGAGASASSCTTTCP